MIEAAVVLSALARHWPDFGIILVLLVANAVVGFWEEHQAGNAIDALKATLAIKARVIRDGKWIAPAARELVPGDVIRVRLGDIVPADARLLEGDPVEVDQSALTGESLPATRKSGERCCADVRSSRSWREIAAPYARADPRRALAQLLNTGLPFLFVMVALLCGTKRYPGLTLPLAVPAALLLVRLFAIQHDCGHGPFFASRRANDLLGRGLGVLTLTPHAFWHRSHSIHHANSGNLDRRGTGGVRTLTVREYRSLSLWQRLRYRAYRHPMILFGLGPVFVFVIRHRIPTVSPFRHWKIWGSILGTNAALAVIVVLMLLTVGGRAFMLGYLPAILLAASTGIWLFYIQHQFEHAYWATGPNWDFHIAALKGSSFYDLPAVLHWLTGYIGFHHIHHICSKIPNYGLRDCFDHNPEFRDARRLTLLDSLRCSRLSLWDEERQLLVSFHHALRGHRAPEG